MATVSGRKIAVVDGGLVAVTNATTTGSSTVDWVQTQGAYTQTYSTAARSVPAMTAAAPAALTAAALTGGESPTEAEHNALLADVTAIRAEVVKLVADLLADKKVINALIDDLQALGLAT